MTQACTRSLGHATRWAASLVVLGIATGAAADPPHERRGYLKCVDDLARDYPRYARLKQEPRLVIERAPDELRYSMTSSAWVEGDRVRLHTRCVTDSTGNRLISRTTETSGAGAKVAESEL